MASNSESFDLSGPLYLTRVDWKNEHHQRSVAACLVQAVYVLERDRQEKREGPQAPAPRWWEFFNFQLHHELVDEADSSIFGAIFEYKPLPSSGNHSADGPHFVVTFRGTLLEDETFSRDIKLDVEFIQHRLHSSSRCETAMQQVQKLVTTPGDSRVWLAGHSLGSAIALLAGKSMAEAESYHESFLFNPPYVSVPFKNKILKRVAQVANSIVCFWWAIATKSREELNQSANSFSALSPWVPRLFVNNVDYVCSGYIDYFEHQKWMQENGAGGIQRVSSHHSLGSMLKSKKKGKQAEPLHLIPSANLSINLDPPGEFLRAHGISEWWKQDLSLESRVCKNISEGFS